MTREKKTQLEEDTFQAWIYASNCLLYEADGGSDVNVGTETDPHLVPHVEAVQISYAQNILTELDGDLGRLQAAARACQQTAAEMQQSRPDYARQNARAADLCERAAQMVIDAGAAGDDRARRRLLAICEHDTTITALGHVPTVADDAKRTLEVTLAEIEAEPDPAAGLPDTLPYQGPSYDEATGRLRLGVGAGGGRAYWTLNTPGVGMECGLICGPPGIGKSSTLRLVLVEAMLQPKFSLWLADPTGRHDLPHSAYTKVADKITTTPRDVLTLLREAVRVIDSRLKRGRFPDPTPQRQGILIALEDCHEIFSDNLEATQLAERIVTDGGPISVALVVTTLDADLDHYGGSLALRTGLARTNRAPMGANGRYMHEVLQQAD